MSVPATQVNKSKFKQKSKKKEAIDKFLKIYKSLWARLFPFKEDYKKLYEEIESLKIELKDEKEMSFVLNKLLEDKELLPELDKIHHSQYTQNPNHSDKKETLEEPEIRLVLHENPINKPTGYKDNTASFQIELFCSLTKQDRQELVDKHGNDIACVAIILSISEFLKDNIELTEDNKKMMDSKEELEILVNWPDTYNFYPISYLATVCARCKAIEEACFFIDNFRLSLARYFDCMRPAIRNGDVELLSTILKAQGANMDWHNYFPLCLEEPNNSGHCAYLSWRTVPNFNLPDYLSKPEYRNVKCDSPLSYALRTGANSKIIQTLLDFGAKDKLECYGYTIDVSKEIAEFLKLEQQRKTAFLMGFHARLGQDSDVFKTLVKSPIFDQKELTRSVFDML